MNKEQAEREIRRGKEWRGPPWRQHPQDPEPLGTQSQASPESFVQRDALGFMLTEVYPGHAVVNHLIAQLTWLGWGESSGAQEALEDTLARRSDPSSPQSGGHGSQVSCYWLSRCTPSVPLPWPPYQEDSRISPGHCHSTIIWLLHLSLRACCS